MRPKVTNRAVAGTEKNLDPGPTNASTFALTGDLEATSVESKTFLSVPFALRMTMKSPAAGVASAASDAVSSATVNDTSVSVTATPPPLSGRA
jgi:hypothetical protein